MAELLDRLTAAVLLGLVTGNLTHIGWHKLKRAGSRRIFPVGGFRRDGWNARGTGEDGHSRSAGAGLDRAGAAVSMVGDAPADIKAARRNGIRSIAVHGPDQREELAALKPDFLLRDLRQLRLRMGWSLGA